MDRLFLDANVLFSAAYKPSSSLRQFWKLRNAVLCTSPYALEEASFNLEEYQQRRALRTLAENLDLFDAVPRPLPDGLSLPEKDAPIFLAAIAARANYLLTGDLRHFGAYFHRRFEGVMIMPPGDYLRSIERRTHGRG